uniref:Uncharacterized protein n=1 Tax=viral metagenome TaxID=1070528 RepID=A0A6C0HLE0_9ZZZZ
MNITYILLGATFAIIIAIGIGIELSNDIDDTIVYALFWLLYVITLITIIAVTLTIIFYFTMQNKQGPSGIQGPQGVRGNAGPIGKCSPSCRDDICTNAVLDAITAQIQTLNNANSNITSIHIPLNNTYIRNKVKQMCASPEFKQIAPFNGPMNLINYLKNVWTDWITLIWNSGGGISHGIASTYFETIGAESEWDWTGNNPFDEIKKYDVYYWGMGPEYRPQLLNACYNTDTEGNVTGSAQVDISMSTTDIYDAITDDTNVGANNRASFWRPKQFTYNSRTYYPLGDVVIGPHLSKTVSNKTRHFGGVIINEPAPGPNCETVLVTGDVLGPVDYSLIWTNNNYHGKQFWVWRPIGPSTPKGDYLALGDVITTNSQPPPTGSDAPIRCVPMSMLTRLPANGNVLWSSMGSKVPGNLLILGFSPNKATPPITPYMPIPPDPPYITAMPSNAYNLFRGVNGMLANIPISDINGNFYTINLTLQNGQSISTTSSNMAGRGYVATGNTPSTSSTSGTPDSTLNSQYSVLTYLNMRNAAILTHQVSHISVNINVAPSSSGVIYTVGINGMCLKNVGGGKVTLATCDSTINEQLFAIEFTGNMPSQCRLKSYVDNMYIILTNTVFSLVNTVSNKDTTQDLSLFIMS